LHTNELEFLNGGDPVDWAPAIPIWLSLTVIFVVLGVTTVASLIRSHVDRPRAGRPQPRTPSTPRPAPLPPGRPMVRASGHPAPVRAAGQGGPAGPSAGRD